MTLAETAKKVADDINSGPIEENSFFIDYISIIHNSSKQGKYKCNIRVPKDISEIELKVLEYLRSQGFEINTIPEPIDDRSYKTLVVSWK